MHITVLWELRHSNADNSVWCAYRRLDAAAHLVTVTVGETERFREQHRTEADAYDEAAYLVDHFMSRGWTEVAYRDPRLASTLTNPPLSGESPPQDADGEADN